MDLRLLFNQADALSITEPEHKILYEVFKHPVVMAYFSRIIESNAISLLQYPTNTIESMKDPKFLIAVARSQGIALCATECLRIVEEGKELYGRTR